MNNIHPAFFALFRGIQAYRCRPNLEWAGPTRSFDGSVKGLGEQIGRLDKKGRLNGFVYEGSRFPQMLA